MRSIALPTPPRPAVRATRAAEAFILVITVVLAAVEVFRIGVLMGPSQLTAAIVAAAILTPIHLWHLRFGLRGVRPPDAEWTLAVMAAVELAMLVYIGPTWVFWFPPFAISAMIVLPPARAVVAFAACLVISVVAYLIDPSEPQRFGIRIGYLPATIAFRTVLQFGLVWLTAAGNELSATREVFARDAAAEAGAQIETRMRATLERALGRLAAEARNARRALSDSGVAVPMVALDRLVDTARESTAELRSAVTDARLREAGASAREHARVSALACSPIGRGLTVRGAKLCFVVTQGYVLGWILVAGLGAFSGAYHTPIGELLPVWCVLTVLQIGAALDLAKGRLRPRAALARFAAVLVLEVLCRHWMTNLDPGWLLTFAAVAGFRGRARAAVATTVYLASAAWSLTHCGDTKASYLIWDGAYYLAITAVGAAALYGSARLIGLLGQLDEARERHVAGAAAAERRRLWGDLHDVLGQSLTAITLKADLARRLVSVDRERSSSELDELIALTATQAQELAQVTRGERTVSFDSELATAIELLRTAGVEVSLDLQAAPVTPEAGALLGWAVREGTTNLLRHSDARRVTLATRERDGEVVLELGNDAARVPAAAGSGLRGLGERAQEVAGHVDGALRDDGGFVLTVRTPA